MLSFVVLAILAVSVSAFSPMGASRLVNKGSTLIMGTMVDNLRFVKHFNRFTFKTLYKAVAAAGLEETLAGAGPFTVLAPTDAAFAELAPGVLDGLLADPEKLKALLTYHVISGSVSGDDIKTQKKLKVLNPTYGVTVSIEQDKAGDRIYLDDAKVLTTDILVDNGVIHVLDMVMIPGQ